MTAWATDDDSEAWFELALDEGSGWIYGANLTLDPPPGTASGAAPASGLSDIRRNTASITLFQRWH